MAEEPIENSWLAISLEDYEAHMSSESVQQLGALSLLFQKSLRFHQPSSVAVLGLRVGMVWSISTPR